MLGIGGTKTMCLTKVIKVLKRPNNKEVVAYKVIDIESNKPILPWLSSFKLEVNTWMKADTSTVIYDETVLHTEYKSGFHVFLSKEQAKKYTCANSVVKVLVRKVATRGIQKVDDIDANILVTKEMYIPFPYEELEKLEC